MSSEDFFERAKIELRKRQRRRSGYLCAFFLVLIVLFGLIRSSQIVFVFLLYASVVLEALTLSIFIARSDDGSLWDLLFTREQMGSVTTFREGSGAVNSLHIYVKYASR
jgi:hypothetical protein